MYFLLKTLVTALVVASSSELAKRSAFWGAIIASLPLTSLLAILWLYKDTADATKAADLCRGIFWAVLPSLLFFLIFPILIKAGMRFFPALGISCMLMGSGYALYSLALKKLGIEF